MARFGSEVNRSRIGHPAETAVISTAGQGPLPAGREARPGLNRPANVGPPGTMYENVLIPTDGSEGADHAVERGLDLAETYDATVHALNVIAPMAAADYGTNQVYEVLREEGQAATDEIARRAGDRGLDAVTEVRTGAPHSEILDYVDDHDVNLVVMGTHGRTGLGRYLLGSVTEKVVRLSDVPVLTVPMDGE